MCVYVFCRMRKRVFFRRDAHTIGRPSVVVVDRPWSIHDVVSFGLIGGGDDALWQRRFSRRLLTAARFHGRRFQRTVIRLERVGTVLRRQNLRMRRISFASFLLALFLSCSFILSFLFFLDATTHLYKWSCPSVRPSVRPYVPCYFRTTNMTVLEGKKSSNDTMSDDEVIASDVRYV